MPRLALLFGAVLVGSVTTLSAWTEGGGLGVAAVDAAQHYTRKKSGGRWTARSAKGGVRGGAGRGKSVRHGRAAQLRSRAAAPPPVSSAAAVAPPGSAPAEALRAAAEEPAVPSASAAVEVAPPARAMSDTLPAAEATTGSISGAAERPLRRSSDLPPPDRVIATASIGVLQPTPGLEKMRSGLEARARSIRAASGDPLSLPLPQETPPVRMVARSVTFDLARGERTIVFEDGETITAPFDRTKATDATGFEPSQR